MDGESHSSPGPAATARDDPWAPAARMIKAVEDAWKEEQERVNGLLAKSDEALRPLQDPFRMDFHSHRPFRPEREEVYSDWLAWIVESAGQMDPCGVLRIFLDKDKVPGDFQEGENGKVHVRAEREEEVKEGHPGHKGFLDLLISMNDIPVLAVEVKTTTAEGADTAKQKGYAKSLKEKGFKGPLVLLATNRDKNEYHGFRLRPWWEACVGLRRLARKLIEQDKSPLAAMVLAFTGIVEQGLLGLSAVKVRDDLVAQILEEYLEQGGST